MVRQGLESRGGGSGGFGMGGSSAGASRGVVAFAKSGGPETPRANRVQSDLVMKLDS